MEFWVNQGISIQNIKGKKASMVLEAMNRLQHRYELIEM